MILALGAPVVLIAFHPLAVGVICVGVPVIAPVEVFSERPAGSAGVTAHVYGAVPPDAANVAEYD